jgi:hypothetical protein
MLPVPETVTAIFGLNLGGALKHAIHVNIKFQFVPQKKYFISITETNQII